MTGRKRGTRRGWTEMILGALALGLVLPLGAAAQDAGPTAVPTAGAEVTATIAPTVAAVVTPSPTATAVTPAAATPTPSPDPGCQEDGGDAEQLDGVSFQEQLQEAWTYDGTGNGPRNVVKLHNRRSGQLRVRGNVQLNRITGDAVDPFNYGIAYNACGEGAATMAVALQLNLYEVGASYVAPENYAFAVNYGCMRCAALAYAVQLVYPVPDPRDVPAAVRELVAEMDRELQAIHVGQHELTLGQAHARVKAVVDRFKAEIPAQFQEAEHQATPTG